MKKYKRTNNDLKKHTHKTRDRITRTPLKTEMNAGAQERWAVVAPLVAPIVVLI